ncbi:MAG: hypothetical protein AUG48_04325 [Actinobacteria bacterium 13_1_20CM_3_68_9]|nr:MAG: hypothetical protein AUG48_04325 [Actinobacteria bacterium 13_1_20CM_3_68_9]
MSGVPVYRGHFGARQAERLLWRAGFGPRPGEARRLASKGLRKAVHSLTRPSRAKLHGPAPTDGAGNPIAPYDAYRHDVLWWLDRTVRTNQPHVERMALIWHDWFATGDVGSQKLGVRQKVTLRTQALGSFKQLFGEVTIDPAMLIWLSGNENSKYAPNENYGREMMELFSLGVSNNSGYPYSEDDVREQARALTGWTNDWDDTIGYTNFRFDPDLHDGGTKTIFGKTGRFGWRDSVELCIEHPAHAPYFVERLWSYFVPPRPSARTRSALVHLYKSSGHRIRPVVEAILMHPSLYEGEAMVKSPVVFIVGLLKARGRGIDTDAWVWISDLAGQQLFDPPNVAGWDETRWLDTSTLRGRWTAVTEIVRAEELDPGRYDHTAEGPRAAVDRALRYWGGPTITKTTRAQLERFGRRVENAIDADWKDGYYRGLRQNALRMLVATAPDLETC